MHCHTARVSFLSHKSCKPQRMPCVVHLAGTGDHSFERRLRLGGPLLKENRAAMVLESPFYGRRRPLQQYGAKLLCVSDLLLLGSATIEEARSLLHWLDYEAGFGRLVWDDGYLPKHSVLVLQKAWPGSEVRWVSGGHVLSFLLHNREFRRAIVDGLDRLEYPS